VGCYGAWGGVVRVEKIIEVFRVIVNNWPCRINVFKLYPTAFGSSTNNNWFLWKDSSHHGQPARASSKFWYYWYATAFSIANPALDEAPCKIAKFIGRKFSHSGSKGTNKN
jgi:hypothetical protein